MISAQHELILYGFGRKKKKSSVNIYEDRDRELKAPAYQCYFTGNRP
jgi:hypothetical protein